MPYRDREKIHLACGLLISPRLTALGTLHHTLSNPASHCLKNCYCVIGSKIWGKICIILRCVAAYIGRKRTARLVASEPRNRRRGVAVSSRGRRCMSRLLTWAVCVIITWTVLFSRLYWRKCDRRGVKMCLLALLNTCYLTALLSILLRWNT